MDASMNTVSSAHIDEVARLFGKAIVDSAGNTRQVLLLSDMTYLGRLGLGALNRDVNQAWVKEIKQVLLNKIMAHERIQLVACIDIRHIQAVLDGDAQPDTLTAIVVDGQHRLFALREIAKEHPGIVYDFRLELYVIRCEAEFEALLHGENNRCAFTETDHSVLAGRKRFVQVFSRLTAGCENRRCVQRTKNQDVLRSDQKVAAALANMSVYEIECAIKTCAAQYKSEWERVATPQVVKSAVGATIARTGMYQLLDWETGRWMQHAFCK